ncbi:DUF512 domain-containing protein [Lutispora sp.]|uniref:DUF512 domain-containing protein n=1 Tax=Lutispora sp. TaxID=2828727 RepID=UPI0035673C7E
MQKAPLHMIYEAASRYNILALTSRCATSCVFCSHHQNPPEVEAFFVSDLTLDEAVTAMEFLDEDKKIIIGESATRLCEGEPFIHKDFIKILRLLREKYKNTPIQITTSGVYLDRETLGTLKSIGGIELNISLNSCTQEGREKLYRGRSLMEAVEAVKNIASYGISFNGSIVAMPHLVGERDIEDTIRFLSRWGAETIRVFMPGYTRYSKIPSPPDNIDDILRGIVTKLRHEIKTPLILEPTILKDLTPVVEGVVPDSPAHKAGFKGGEIITRINDEAVFSRADAYYAILASANPDIEYSVDGVIKKTVLPKNSGERSGLVFNYDIDKETVEAINKVIGKNQGKRCLLGVSKFGYRVIKECFKNEDVDIEIIENNYFGGNIGCSGLLVLEDVKQKLAEKNYEYDVIILPAVMFDSRGRDLTGKHYKDLEEETRIKIHLTE